MKKNKKQFTNANNNKTIEETISIVEKEVSRTKKIIFILLLLIVSIEIILFYKVGMGGFHVTLTIYIFALYAISLINKNIIKVNTFIIVLILFCFELYIRFSNKNLSYTEANSNTIFTPYFSRSYGQNNSLINKLKINKPNSISYSGKLEFNYKHTYNELGFREKIFSNYINKDNIVVLGDSYTEGVGAPDDSTGLKSIQQNLLRKNLNYNIINCGVSGSDIIYSSLLLDTLNKILKPKIIIYNLHYSDIDDIIFRGGYERFLKGSRKSYWWEFIYSWSFIVRNILNGNNINPFNTNYKDYQYALNTIQNTLNDYNLFCLKNNIEFITVLTPGPSEIYQIYRETQSKIVWKGNMKYILEYNKQMNDIKFIDTQYKIYNLIARDNNIRKYYYKLDYHFKPKGYWCWGEIVSDELIKLYK